jgi:tRNA dimethylallyltransferase
VTAPPLLVIAGATATGKTGLAVDIAERLIGEGIAVEVISADSRQVYRGLDIGTAKATLAQRRGIEHHGLDLVDPDQPFSVADFAAHARGVLKRLASNGAPVLAILAGGTGLYLRAIARGIDTQALPSDPEIRARIEEERANEGLDALVARLRVLAPERAARVDTKNPRRVVRAMEVAELTGDGPPPPFTPYAGPIAWAGLAVEPAVHREWIATRARAQFAAGLIDEARDMRDRYDRDLPAFSAIGYREAWSVIDGVATLEDAIAADIARNVAFAKRQRTWFRAEPEITWLDVASASPVEPTLSVARALVATGRGGAS